MNLREYQRAACAAVVEHWAGSSPLGALLVMATGTGKTITALSLVADFIRAGKRVVWLAHRDELITQPAEAWRACWPDLAGKAGTVKASQNQFARPLVFASVQTLANGERLRTLAAAFSSVDLVVVDEAHHSISQTYRAVLDGLGAKNLLGLTATPDRADWDNLADLWELVFSFDTAQAIAAGFLLPPWVAVSRLPDLNLSAVSGRRDYQDGALAAELIRAGVIAHTVDAFKSTFEALRHPERDQPRQMRIEDRRTIVFCATVEQARLTAEALKEAGILAAWVSGKTSRADRVRLARAFRCGRLQVICNAAVYTEGTDFPLCSAVILARPTKSWSLYVQMVGRALRLSPNQRDALIIDLGGVSEVHSLVCAPVLVGGTRCPNSPNGAHDFQQIEGTTRGKCVHCPRKVPCFPRLGAHDFKAGTCTACNAPQCADSPDNRHLWIPNADLMRVCGWCGASSADPLSSMRADVKPKRVDAPWVSIPGVVPESYAVHCGDLGLLFVVGDRNAAKGAGEWRMFWVKKGGRKARPLTADPIPSDLVRAYSENLVSRCERIASRERRAPSGGEIRYAERVGVEAKPGMTAEDLRRETTRAKARQKLIEMDLAEVIGG